jgi:hypothetical protein
MRGIQYPVHDVVKISRDYAFPDFILGLLKQLHTG